MAAWQFDVEAVSEHGDHSFPPLMSRRAQTLLADGFPPPWKMLARWDVYGQESGNRIDLVSDPDGSCELSARIDARSDPESFLTRWILVMTQMNCSLYSPELDRAFPADMDSLKDALQASAAWRYALARG